MSTTDKPMTIYSTPLHELGGRRRGLFRYCSNFHDGGGQGIKRLWLILPWRGTTTYSLLGPPPRLQLCTSHAPVSPSPTERDGGSKVPPNIRFFMWRQVSLTGDSVPAPRANLGACEHGWNNGKCGVATVIDEIRTLNLFVLTVVYSIIYVYTLVFTHVNCECFRQNLS